MKNEQLNALFRALAHPVRREILDIVNANPGSNISEICEYFSMSRIAVMKHIGLLESAQLLLSEKAGRTRLLYFNIMPIQSIYDRWTNQFVGTWARSISRFKQGLERKGKAHEQKSQSHI